MSGLSDAAQLAASHMATQVRDAAKVQAALAIVFDRVVNPNDLDGSYRRFLTAALPIIQRGRLGGVDAAKAYFLEAKLRAGYPGSIPSLTPPSLERQGAALALTVNGPVAAKARIAKGMPVDSAMTFAKVAVMRAAKRLTLEAPRDTLIDLSKRDKHVLAVSRVSDGAPCHFCAMLVSRGPVYTEKTGRFKAHNGCGCSVRPVFKGEEDGGWTPDARKLASLWSDTGDLNSFRVALAASRA